MTADRSSMTGPDASVSRINMTSLLAGFALGAVLASFAWVQILPGDAGGVNPEDLVVFQVGEGGPAVDGGDVAASGPQRRVIQQGGDGGASEAASGGVNLGDGVGGGTGGGSGGGAAGSGDTTGVTDSSIKFGATYVSDGLACAFLCEVRDAMEAVRSRVNKSGGVHGRQLNIVYKADGWDPTRGARFLENLIVEEKVFAFAVSPSSEGLNSAAETGLFEKHEVPVVGADGLNNSQFINVKTGEANPWIWPVATATTTNVHIIMKDAWKRSGGDLRPAIVFGNTYKFGVEGAYAFNQAYERLSGKDIPGYRDGEQSCKANSRYCGIPGDWRGGGETVTLEQACGSDCNFLLVLLEPGTALNWMAKFTVPASVRNGYGLAGAQPLFTTNYGDGCGDKCKGMRVWTGYKPPSAFQQESEVADYTRALTAQNASADTENQFTMGGYVGMELLVQALDEAGKDLTRGKLIDALNSLSLETGLTVAESLSWSSGQKYANDAAHGFAMTYSATQGTFTGFKQPTVKVTDDWLGEDNQTP